MVDESRREKLESLTADELRQRARQAGHTGLSRLKKAELVDLLLNEKSSEAKSESASQSTSAAHTTGDGTETGTPASPWIVGKLLQSVGLIGGLISLVLTLALPVAVIWYSGRAAGWLESVAAGVEGSAAGVDLAAGNLESVSAALSSGGQALRTADQSLQSMDPLLTSVGDLMADELPESIEATQEALVSAQDSAGAMDRVLRGLRLFGLNYDPDLPLDQSLAQTAESLNGLPESLRQTEQDLNRSQRDLNQMSADLMLLATDLEDLAEDLEESAGEARQASKALNNAAGSLRTLAQRIPLLRWPLAAAAFLFGLWLIVLHLNLWVSGRTVRMS